MRARARPPRRSRPTRERERDPRDGSQNAGFFSRTGEHRTRRVSSPETRGSAWTRPRHARDERRVARPKQSRRRSRVALDRPGTPRRVRGAISGTSVSKRIISRRSDTSIAVCQVSPPRRPAAPRRAERAERARSRRRGVSPAPARRGARRRARGRTRRPARGGRRSARHTQQPNTSRERQFRCRARVRLRNHGAGSLAFRRLSNKFFWRRARRVARRARTRRRLLLVSTLTVRCD